ncbi:MAG TPA: hypothetical protein VMJ10_01880 [Kofleriaceae bacterium]|nr:hypothetical protein [Kofleriaceae bacterium]
MLKRCAMIARLSCLALVLAGCNLYWDGVPPPDAPICAGPGGGSIAVLELRDPSSGDCENFSPGGCPCGTDCAEPLVPDWATCTGACEQLDESACLAAPGCHGAYWVSNLEDNMGPVFWGCWEVEPTGPIQGSCTGLDPYTCTAHDDCIGLYEQQTDTSPIYQGCAPEPKSPQAACSSLTTEAACKARPDCDPIYVGSDCTCDEHGCTCQTETFEYCGGDPTACDGVSCASGTECVVTSSPTGWVSSCVAPATAGTCTGATDCDIAIDCPAGTTPGIRGDCYTLDCIPLAECAQN